MREYLRNIREVQTADYLSQVINEVVPLERDVSLLSYVFCLCGRIDGLTGAWPDAEPPVRW